MADSLLGALWETKEKVEGSKTKGEKEFSTDTDSEWGVVGTAARCV